MTLRCFMACAFLVAHDVASSCLQCACCSMCKLGTGTLSLCACGQQSHASMKTGLQLRAQGYTFFVNVSWLVL